MKREFPGNLAHKDFKKALFPGISRTKLLKRALSQGISRTKVLTGDLLQKGLCARFPEKRPILKMFVRLIPSIRLFGAL
jgi:hypothetical protein